MYGEVHIAVEFENSEVVDNICDDLETKVSKFIVEEMEKTGTVTKFNFDIDSVDCGGRHADINVSSDRYQNAEWMAERIVTYLTTKHKEDVVMVDATASVPETIIYWEKEN
jgi:hypothetical protein